MSREEFTETPYAASFGPVPVSYHDPFEPLDGTAGDDESTGERSSAPELADPAAPPQAVQPPRAAIHQQNGIPDMQGVLMDENMAQSLAAAEVLQGIQLHESAKWDDTVGVVANGLRSIQTRWSILEAERKRLTKPANPTAAPMTRGVRRRGRGRGRRRGRWRAI